MATRTRVIGLLGTEIELLVSPDDSAMAVFATTRLHAEAAVSAALAPSVMSARSRVEVLG